MAEDAVLLTCELATNVIKHVQSLMTVSVALEDEHVRITVSDDSSHRPWCRDQSKPWDASGRGLLLVDAMATSWGVSPAARGKAVWFELARRQ